MLETVITLFILSAAMLVSFRLFYRATSWQGEIELRATALTLALDKIAELELAAQDLNEFQNKLSSLDGTSVVATHPGFEIEVVVSPLTNCATASTTFELPFAGPPTPPGPVFVDVLNGMVSDDRRLMPNSMLVADVIVRAGAANRMRPVTLTVLLREPPRVAETLTISPPVPSNIAPLQSSNCTAEVFDANGNRIEDVTLDWTVRPVTTYGTVFQSRDGRVGALQYLDESPAGVAGVPPAGECAMRVSARVEGRTIFAVSGAVRLGP